MNMRMLALLSLIVVGGLSACGINESKDSSGTEPSAGIAYDYQPLSGPSALERESSVVVRGVTGSPHEGRVWGASRNDPGAQFTLVFPIQIESVVAGKLDPEVGDTAYLEMFVGGSPVREQFAEGLSDREGLFYLYRMPDKVSSHTEIVDLDAGRPSGQPLYQPASPEGTFIETRDGSGVWSVGVGREFEGETLDAFMPSEDEFPEVGEE